MSISDARLAANRANAQHSTGARTEEGKAKSSLNALKNGLTGHTVVLPTEDAIAYQALVDRYVAEHAPVTDREKELVQSIADTQWRLFRIPGIEQGFYTNGRREFANELAEGEPEELLLSRIFSFYRKELSNLALQERRLRKQRLEDVAELKVLQHERKEKEKEEAQAPTKEQQRAIKIAENCRRNNLEFVPADHGFEFTFAEWQAFVKHNNRQMRMTDVEPDLFQWLARHRAAA